MFRITSTAISRHTDSSMADLRIAPSMPTQELNLCSLIARSTPRIVSSVTAISKMRKNELPASNIIILFIIFTHPFCFSRYYKNILLPPYSDGAPSVNIHMHNLPHLHLQAAAICVSSGRYIRIGRMSIHSSCCDIMDPILLFMISYDWHGSLP